MIGAMPAVAVRHERRRQEKRLKRPSQLYFTGQWLPPSPPTPSPHGPNNLEPLPELYLCGKISGLHAVVVCLLLGAVVLVVGLVQLAPGAATTNHRLALLLAGAALLILGFIIAAVRCYVLHCVPLSVESPIATPVPPPAANEQTPAVPKGTLDLLVGHQNQEAGDCGCMLMQQYREHHHHHHQHHSHHNNHKKKRSSQGSHSEEA